MSVIALIPAKGTSRRIPGKNMMDFCGKPLVMWSVNQALESKLVDRVCISTDIPNQIAHSMIPFNPRTISKIDLLYRRENLCADTTTQEEVISHAIETLNLKDDDVIVLLQPTSPLRLPGDIDECIEIMTKFGNSACWSVVPNDDLFLWDDDIEPYNFERDMRSVMPLFIETGSIYAFEVGQFKAIGNRYAGAKGMSYQQKWQQFEIDEPEDIEIVEYFMKTKILKEGK